MNRPRIRLRRHIFERLIDSDIIPFITMKHLSDKQEETINKNEFQEKYGFLFREYELISNIIKKQEEEDDTYISDIKSSIIALKNSQNHYIKEVFSKINEEELTKQFLEEALETINTDINLFNRIIEEKHRRSMISRSSLRMYKLMADIAKTNHKVSKVYDPSCNEGLTLTALKEFDEATLYEKEEELYLQAIQNFIVNDIPLEKINIKKDDILIDEDKTKYDTIISDPVISGQLKLTYSIPQEFEKYRTRNPSSINLLNLIDHLDENGILITVITQDLLVRKDALNLRQCLIEKNLLDTVIEYNTLRRDNKLILVINKNKKTEDVLFIKTTPPVMVRSIRNGKLLDCYKERKTIKYFSQVVTKEELINNEYKILPKRYVYSLHYVKHSIEEVKKQQQEYTEEIHKLDDEISQLLEKLNE